MAETILSGKRLRKVFDGIIAVDNVSFAVEEQTITAIIGPNGAGKTTLFNLVTGFIPPEQGEVYLQGRNLNGTPPHEVARLGISRTFQDLRLLRQISVRDNLLLSCPNQIGEVFWRALFSHRVGSEEANNYEEALELLDFVGLKALTNEPAGNLSYGQQKLLSLACCLATKGKVLLLDEPVAGVHPDMAARILDLMVRLRDQGKTIVFIEHDIEAVKKVAGRVVVMDDGKVIASGSKEEVLAKAEIIEAYLT